MKDKPLNLLGGYLKLRHFPYTDDEPEGSDSGAEKTKVMLLITKEMRAPNSALVGFGGAKVVGARVD
jgi:hypothetical protein